MDFFFRFLRIGSVERERIASAFGPVIYLRQADSAKVCAEGKTAYFAARYDFKSDMMGLKGMREK